MMNAPVLPVPFLARAMMLFLSIMSGTDSSCMGVGTRYPASVSASMMLSCNFSSLKFLYLVALIS
jgi:hypothetical protein